MSNAGELTDEVVDSFLPWSSKVFEKCSFPEGARDKAVIEKDDPIVDVNFYLFDDGMKNNQEECPQLQRSQPVNLRETYKLKP